jgi:DNA-binding NarL/FixJ family response regulator
MVLMDLSMPSLSGIELFWKLRQIRKSVPVILTSAYDQTKAVRQFAGRRLAGFLQKPFSASTLIQTIGKYVETVE